MTAIPEEELTRALQLLLDFLMSLEKRLEEVERLLNITRKEN